MYKKLLKYKEQIYCLTLSLITFIVYWPSIKYPFQFDDLPNIANYTKLKTESLYSLIFSHSRWTCYFLNTILYKWFDSNPLICRLLNISFHTFTGLLIFWLILKFKNVLKQNTFKIASITSILFLLHPVQTQTVSYVIQGQLEGLASLFILLCIACFYKYTIKEKTTWYICTITFLILATSTKEIAIVTPFLILLVDWFWIALGNIKDLKKRIWIHIINFAVTASMYLYYLKPNFFINILSGNQITQISNGNILSDTGAETISQYQFLISQFKVILHYIWIFIWPFNICVEYDWQLSKNFFSYDCLMPLTILTIVLISILSLLRKNKIHPIVFGTLWFLICILPRSSFIASAELLVDYKTYLASFGILFIITYLLVQIINKTTNPKQSNIVYLCLAIIFIPTLLITTQCRNLVWSSPLLFWQDVTNKAPKKARGFNNLGMALVDTGKYKDAIPYFKQAITINNAKNKNTFYWDPYRNIANCYAILGNIDLAIDILNQGIKINPNIAEMHNNLGALLLHKRKTNQAIKHLKKALQLKPNFGQSMYTLAKAYLQVNKIELAWILINKAINETHMDRNKAALKLYNEINNLLNKTENKND